MIKSVTVTNPKGESLKLELTNPEKSGLVVESIEGLGPPQANIQVIELATSDGSLYSSARVGTRNIVMNLIMYPWPTIEDSRQMTYRYFPLKKKIDIVIETDNRTLRTSGYVESNEPDIFSKLESCQISILCMDPFFYDLRASETSFTTAAPLFEFPFSNESISDNMIEMGMINLDTRAILDYKGDVDTGVLITIHFMGTSKHITLYNVDTHESLTIDTSKFQSLIGRDLGPGDDIVISTISGDKYVNVVHEGQITNAISTINKDADWFKISPGTNMFNFVAESGVEMITVTFSYKNAYGGI